MKTPAKTNQQHGQAEQRPVADPKDWAIVVRPRWTLVFDTKREARAAAVPASLRQPRRTGKPT